MRIPFVIAAMLAAVLLVHLFVRAPVYPYTPDSAGYIEQARNLVAHGKAISGPYDLSEDVALPSRLFPVGFAVVLAALSLTGIEPATLATATGWAAAVALPLLLFAAFRRVVGEWSALVVAVLSALSPGILTFAGFALSDLLALLLAVGAIGLALNDQRAATWFAAGVLAGLSYAIRNASLALLMAFAMYFAWQFFFPFERKRPVERFLAFAIGVAVFVIPVLVRNLWVFGELNPYQMAPSTVGVEQNVRAYIQEFVYDFTAVRNVGRLVAWSAPGLAAAGVILLLLLYSLRQRVHRLPAIRRDALVLCGAYTLLGAAVVIAARSRYEWGELINTRHTLQVIPFFAVTLLVLWPIEVPGRIGPVRRGWQGIVAVICAIHVMYASVLDGQRIHVDRRGQGALDALEVGATYMCSEADGAIPLSNWAYVFVIECAAKVRQFEPGGSGIASAMNELVQSRPRTAWRVALFPGRAGVTAHDLPLSESVRAGLENDGWVVVRNDARGLIASRF